MLNNKRLCNFIIFILCVSVLTVSSSSSVYSAELPKKETESSNDTANGINDAAGIATGSTRTVNDVIAQYKFNSPTGHGFAAEQGNNFIDSIKGKNTQVIGDNNVKNGADRKILNRDGSVLLIQDKYYNSANASIDACFDESGQFRYIDADGNIMQIEVPKDQYEKAVERIAQKIREGKIPGVTNVKEAESIVRKGNLTYKQARNLAKAGTVESLKYDAAHGVISTSCAFGISTVLNYAVCRMNGMEKADALRTSAIEGVKCGTGAFATAVIAGQLSKTGIMNVFKPSSEALTKALGDDFSKALLKAYGQKVIAAEGESVAESATKQAAKLLRSEVLVAVVTTVVFTAPDAYDMFKGRISKKQFVKNFAVTAVSVFAGAAGAGVGGAVSNLLVPGVGTIPGAIVGSILFGTGGAVIADKIADYITDDDADEMYAILEEHFAQYCEEYMVNETEADEIVGKFGDSLTEDMFKEMYQSKNRDLFAEEKLTPLFEEVVSKRKVISTPTEEELRASLLEELDGVVFIH